MLDSAAYFFPDPRPGGWGPLLALVGVAVLVGVARTLPKESVELKLKAIDTIVSIRFGNIFDFKQILAIPVNEFFDSELGDHVSHRSLHGQLISSVFSGVSQSFNSIVDEDLRDVQSKIVCRPSGRGKQYAIGVTPMINIGTNEQRRFLLPAVCRTDLKTLKASCDVPTLWTALVGLWAAVRNRAGGDPVAVPLIGGGLAGLGLPPSQLLHLIVLSLVVTSRQTHIASPITIVLPPDRFDDFELAALKEQWS